MNNASESIIIPYQPAWVEKFQYEKQGFEKVFGDLALEIEHIGSTSIVGLASKPIIDIVVMISDYNDAGAFTKPLTEIGYQLGPSSTERDYYIKGDPVEFHLSIAFADRGGFWPRQILFRDYLRAHPDIRDEYGQLKKQLLEQDPTGVTTYIEGKTAFIYKVLQLTGWKEGQTYR